MHRRGEIVLIPVPFSDLTATKKRPVSSFQMMNSRKERGRCCCHNLCAQGSDTPICFDQPFSLKIIT